MDFLVVGNGMFGAAVARYLAPHATVTVIGAEARTDGSGVYGAHHDEGRIIGDLPRDVVWSELNRQARAGMAGMAGLAPGLVTPCGALTARVPGGPDYPGVAAGLQERYGSDIRVLSAEEARGGFPMASFDSGETVMYQPEAGHFSPQRYVALASRAARDHGAVIVPGTVRGLRTSAAGMEAGLSDGRRVRAGAAIVATGAFAAGSDLLPVPVALRAKSEVYVMAELDDSEAAGLAAMPCINRPIRHPELADLYVLPPIRYPDGRAYIKFGANTLTDRWLPDSATVRAWYAVRSGRVDGQSPHPSGPGGGTSLGLAWFAPVQDRGRMSQGRHAPPVECAAVCVWGPRREFGDDAGHPDLSEGNRPGSQTSW